MVTFLSGGTGTPKLLSGARRAAALDGATVIGNTGDDVELGGLLVCPDVDTVLYLLGDRLDRETWWGVDGDTAETHDEVLELTAAADEVPGPRYLDEDRQTSGRDLARWRRFSAVGEFMHIGDRDRAVHLARTSLIDAGHTLTEAIAWLGRALGTDVDVLPMSDDPVATLVQTPDGPIHFQEYWVARGGDVHIDDVAFRGASDARPTDAVLDALEEPVILGPSNPVTSIGPMLALSGIRKALEVTPVVAVSPFVEDRVFSGPAADLMAAVGDEPSTAGVAAAYPFVDAFVLDEADETELDRPVVRTDTTMTDEAAAERVFHACEDAMAAVA